MPPKNKISVDQKDPHSERGGFFLLLQRLEIGPNQLSGAVHSVFLFSFAT